MTLLDAHLNKEEFFSFKLKLTVPKSYLLSVTGFRDEKRLLSSNRSQSERPPPLCHPERSRGIRSSADHSWEYFFDGGTMGTQAHPRQ